MEDLAPLAADQRPWRWHTFAALWAVMTLNPAMYSLGGSLVALGLSAVDSLVCTAVGSVFVAVAIIVNSAPGVAHGIPFPVYARAAFGIQGAKFAALSRGLVGVMWLSFQLWISAEGLLRGLERAVPGIRGWAPIWEPYLSGSELVSLLLMAAAHVALIACGVKHFKNLSYIIALPCFLLFALVMAWGVSPSWGGSDLAEVFHLDLGDVPAGGGGLGQGWTAWLGGLNSLVSMYSTIMLNMADLARLAPTQADQAWGQMLGIPLPTLFSVAAGIIGSAAVQAKTGKPAWQIFEVFEYWPAWACVLAGIIIALSTISVNISANIIPPANDFMNLNPDGFRWRHCAYSTIVLAVLSCPFYLFDSPTGFALRFLGGYGMVTGTLYGIMVTDYFWMRQKCLSLDDLYPSKPDASAFHYWRGHNWRAIVAIVAGMLLPLPAWLGQLAGSTSMPYFLELCNRASWFVACAVSGLVYAAACVASPPPRSGEKDDASMNPGEAENGS